MLKWNSLLALFVLCLIAQCDSKVMVYWVMT